MERWPLQWTLPLHVFSHGDWHLAFHSCFPVWNVDPPNGCWTEYVGSHIYRMLLNAPINKTLFHANEDQWAWSQSFPMWETIHAATFWHSFCSNYSYFPPPPPPFFFINERRHSSLNSQRHLGIQLMLKSLVNLSIRHSSSLLSLMK